MSRLVPVVLALLLAAGLAPSARAQEAETEGPAAAVGHHRVLALLNPMGVEHRLDLGLRRDVGDQEDILFEGAHVQTGLTSYVAPVYAIGGGYVEISPFSFLGLRGEIMGAGVWPIGMDAAGYYGVPGYDADVRGQALPGGDGRSASGWMATGSVELRGALEVAAGVRILLLSELGVTWTVLGDAPFHYSMKHDLVLARQDLVVLSSSFAGVEVRAARDIVVRFGAYDDLRHVPASGYVGHQLGPMATISWEHPVDGVGELTIFLRGGGYTHHATREGEATILGGVALDYELGSIR